jgi:hypothetical protein
MRTLLPLTLLACGPSDDLRVGELLPAFALEDVNPTSPSFEDVVSTDTHAARTAWYFGHAT